MHIRVRVKKVGTHWRCRLFTGAAANANHALCGELVFNEQEWPAVRDQFERIAEVIIEEDGQGRPCPECNGIGKVLDAPARVLDGHAYMTTCVECKGTGRDLSTAVEPGPSVKPRPQP